MYLPCLIKRNIWFLHLSNYKFFIYLSFLDLLLHYTAPPVCADRYGKIQTQEAVVSASHHPERTIMQSTSIFHIPQASASAPNLLSFASPTHHTALSVCADRYGEILTEGAVVSASHHLERTIM